MPKRYVVDGRECNNPQGVRVEVTLPNGEPDILYDPHPKQLEFHERTEPNVLMFGGRGSGKSVAMRWEAHLRALATPNFHYCILRRTYPELQKTHLKFLDAEMRKLGGHFNKTEKIAYYPNGSRGFFSHCAGDEDVLNLLGSQFYWMGFDELSTFPWDMFMKLATSVRVPEDVPVIAMVRACTNPLGPSADEINHYFIEKDVDLQEEPDYAPDDWYAVKANIGDNPSLSAEEYLKRFAGQPDHIRKAWVDGDFMLENALFDVKPTKRVTIDGVEQTVQYHYITSIDLPTVVKAGRIYRAMDIGWFPDPTYILWIARLGNRFIVFHEKILYKTIAPDVAEIIKLEDAKLGVTKVVTTYADPTIMMNTLHDVHSLKDIFEINGIPIEESVNDRMRYASAIHTALGQEAGLNTPKLQIYVGNKNFGCPYLAKSLPKQRYDIKNALKMADQNDDHPAVTLAYFLISSNALDIRPAEQQAELRPWMKEKGNTQWILGSESVNSFSKTKH